MLKYSPQLRKSARQLRNDLTDAEQLMGSLERKASLGKILSAKTIGNYIVSLYAPRVRWLLKWMGHNIWNHNTHATTCNAASLWRTLGSQCSDLTTDKCYWNWFVWQKKVSES